MTIGAEGTIVCPLEAINCLKDSRISFAVSISVLIIRYDKDKYFRNDLKSIAPFNRAKVMIKTC
jgi:hypothetical protein